MDRPTLLAVVVAVAVIAWFVIQGWWLLLAACSLVSLVCAYMAWRAGMPWFRARDDE